MNNSTVLFDDTQTVMFVAFDIYQYVKELCNRFLGEYPDMTDGEKEAYKLGSQNTLSLLEQALNKFTEDKPGYDYLALHIKDLYIENELMMEEFLSIEEIEDKIDEIRLKERR